MQLIDFFRSALGKDYFACNCAYQERVDIFSLKRKQRVKSIYTHPSEPVTSLLYFPYRSELLASTPIGFLVYTSAETPSAAPGRKSQGITERPSVNTLRFKFIMDTNSTHVFTAAAVSENTLVTC